MVIFQLMVLQAKVAIPFIFLWISFSHCSFFNFISPIKQLHVKHKTTQYFSESERNKLAEEAKQMFYNSYNNYVDHAFPLDELDPIHCTGRGPDYDDPDNININDVLGNFSLSLIESLSTLAVMGNTSEFQRAVKSIIKTVSFNTANTVQVFEVTIRVIGPLLSAHLLMTDEDSPFGELRYPEYNDELLSLAHDLASRVLPAFERTKTGIPYPRVNLKYGVTRDIINETCTAGAGTLTLELGVLSRLLGDPVYDSVARRAVASLWRLKDNSTGLLGNVVDIQSGQWSGRMSGLGAGIDSFYEYLLKSYILFGDQEHLAMFNEFYDNFKKHMRVGRRHCNAGLGQPPLYVNVNMMTGDLYTRWIDALQAAWPSVQVLAGDVEEAICLHAVYFAVWQRFSALPERFNWNVKAPEVFFYPLRPELMESTYHLYQATKNPYYLHVGKQLLRDLEKHTRVKCGYATIHDVRTMEHEDRMESFFLSETTKYLYLLFDKDNPVNRLKHKYIFTTEGHLLPLLRQFRRPAWEAVLNSKSARDLRVSEAPSNSNTSHANCARLRRERSYLSPLGASYLRQVEDAVGLEQVALTSLL